MRTTYALNWHYIMHDIHIRNLNEGTLNEVCVFFMKKRNGFCVKTPCFLWFQNTFCSEFCLSLGDETEFFSLSLGCFFCYLYFLDVLWNSYQLLLILLIGERCFIWVFHLLSLFILN